MARDRATIKTDIWGDSDWRSLSIGAQWLYMHLLSSPDLSYIGITDWRPNRIAVKVATEDESTVRGFASELENGRFAFTDEHTEEVLVRSFLRHDGLLMNPNLWKSIGNDFADAGSNFLRGIVAEEARRLRDEAPDGFETSKGGKVNPWPSKHLATMLATPCLTPSGTPSDTPSETPSREVARGGLPTTTATSTATPQLEIGGAPSAPSPFCKRHPDGTDKPCRGCKVAWNEYEKWAADDGPVTHTHRWLSDGSCLGCTEMQEDN